MGGASSAKSLLLIVLLHCQLATVAFCCLGDTLQSATETVTAAIDTCNTATGLATAGVGDTFRKFCGSMAKTTNADHFGPRNPPRADSAYPSVGLNRDSAWNLEQRRRQQQRRPRRHANGGASGGDKSSRGSDEDAGTAAEVDDVANFMDPWFPAQQTSLALVKEGREAGFHYPASYRIQQTQTAEAGAAVFRSPLHADYVKKNRAYFTPNEIRTSQNVYPLSMGQYARQISQQEMGLRIKWSLADRLDCNAHQKLEMLICEREKRIRRLIAANSQYLPGTDNGGKAGDVLRKALSEFATDGSLKIPANFDSLLGILVPLSNQEREHILRGMETHCSRIEEKYIGAKDAVVPSAVAKMLFHAICSATTGRDTGFGVNRSRNLLEDTKVLVEDYWKSKQKFPQVVELLTHANFDHLREVVNAVPIRDLADFEFARLERLLLKDGAGQFQKMYVAILMDIGFGRPRLVAALLKKNMMDVVKSEDKKTLSSSLANMWRLFASRASIDLADVNDLMPNGGLLGALKLLKHLRAQKTGTKKNDEELVLAQLDGMNKFVRQVLLEFSNSEKEDNGQSKRRQQQS